MARHYHRSKQNAAADRSKRATAAVDQDVALPLLRDRKRKAKKRAGKTLGVVEGNPQGTTDRALRVHRTTRKAFAEGRSADASRHAAAYVVELAIWSDYPLK